MVSSRAPSLTVVYLAYLPYGREPVDRFLESYRAHDAGRAHMLAIVEKGEGETLPYQTLKAPNNCLDLGTYLWTARTLRADRFLFLNTSSEILDDDWLAKLDRHLQGNAGIVGCTGSYGKNWHKGRPRNPHVRTNAFMLDRDLMLSLDWQEPICDKQRAFDVEHGERSLTVQIRERGLEPLVVGRDGEAYHVGEWAKSNTFWIGDQENLLIADNATRKYQEALNGSQRRVWTRFAWA